MATVSPPAPGRRHDAGRASSIGGSPRRHALLQITAPHYCAGIVIGDGMIIDAAPILRWTIGKRLWDVQQYFFRKKFEITIASENCDDHEMLLR
jgi:hypothetical protein